GTSGRRTGTVVGRRLGHDRLPDRAGPTHFSTRVPRAAARARSSRNDSVTTGSRTGRGPPTSRPGYLGPPHGLGRRAADRRRPARRASPHGATAPEPTA